MTHHTRRTMADRDRYIRQLGLPTDSRRRRCLDAITEALRGGDLERAQQLHADYYDDSEPYWTRTWGQRGRAELTDPDETVTVRSKAGAERAFLSWNVNGFFQFEQLRLMSLFSERMDHDDAAQLILERHWEESRE